MNAEHLIEALKREQAITALESAKNPQGRDAFELGKITGLVNGYERALQLIEGIQEEAAGRERPAEQRRVERLSRNPYLEDLDNAPLLPEQYGTRGRRR